MRFDKPYHRVVSIRGVDEPIAFILDHGELVINTSLEREDLERAVEALIEENDELRRVAREAERTYEYMHRQLTKYQEQNNADTQQDFDHRESGEGP